ncbi:sodium:calcium antiporter [Desulforamulus hydrothermalis]|uniref:Sodium/calcium exchanger membrane region n=1 Tax=Desulforamulus hydrothermalis Lam5 = DSM 18033 TaxID=1121428 RepID=K8DYK3_9FIRM|nr:sodium:calcium antiporter [Desulforamulus hydrothermalis]CCO07909.1 Sodium/calcium exchanger membrane region [Desulforamulus hydrothermalis Lam5 = DSM 18033]SHH34785.1 cation:H+ antiporter [Desulforamulus hydrothermalis Lam5 = DSM 18033]
MTYLLLIASLAIILLSAEVFTNGIEWLGKKLNLSEGAVGSLLAAVGTALPETMIPVIAILFGTGDMAEEVGIGAILGAPFMLSTLALSITGFAALVWKVKGKQRESMLIDKQVMNRDLKFFLLVYTTAVLAGIFSDGFKPAVALFLIAAYLYYVYKTLGCAGDQCENLNPLYLARRQANPGLLPVLSQVIIALAGIILGAHLFVIEIERLAAVWGVPAFILSLIIAPIATELPEKFNSVIWVRQGKDTLALGNITGAMVFQSSVIPALGILLTPWKLSPLGLICAILALTAAGSVFLLLRWRGEIRPLTLALNSVFYLIFVGAVIVMY